MKWCRIDLTNKQVDADEINEIHKELEFIGVSQKIPKAFCVLIGLKTITGQSLYFSPETAPFTQSVLHNYNWILCEKPPYEDVEDVLYSKDEAFCWSLFNK